MEIPSHVSFYSGFTIWIINCTIWPAGIGRRSLNLRRAERELGGGSAQCERKNPTQRNKSPRFVISHQLSIPLFFPPQLISSQLISPCPPPNPPSLPNDHYFLPLHFSTSACPLFLLSFYSAFPPITSFSFPRACSFFQSSGSPDFHKIIPPVWRPWWVSAH